MLQVRGTVMCPKSGSTETAERGVVFSALLMITLVCACVDAYMFIYCSVCIRVYENLYLSIYNVCTCFMYTLVVHSSGLYL